MLIAARMIQAAGAASASAISLAIAKDRLEAKEREAVMGYVSVIMALAPMIAPTIGGLIITRSSWHWIFILQGIMGIVALISVIFTPESNPMPVGSSVKELVKSYGRILANGRFMSVVSCTSLVGLPFFGYIAASSSIYITSFHLSENAFGLFFGGNSLCFMAGAMICARLGHRFSSVSMMSMGFAGLTVGGVIMGLGVVPGPWGWPFPWASSLFPLESAVHPPTTWP